MPIATPITPARINKRAPQPWLKWIIVGGLTVVIALALVSYLHPYMEERFKFWAATAVNALILTAILVQVYVYTKQWEAMQDGLKENRRQIKVAEQQLEATKASTDALVTQIEVFKETEGPHFGTSRIVFHWAPGESNGAGGFRASRIAPGGNYVHEWR